jgi:hypothetical protein
MSVDNPFPGITPRSQGTEQSSLHLGEFQGDLHNKIITGSLIPPLPLAEEDPAAKTQCAIEPAAVPAALQRRSEACARCRLCIECRL